MTQREKVGFQVSMFIEGGKEALKQMGSSSKKTDEDSFLWKGGYVWQNNMVL